jgi:2-polyprenyl-3-methyl-5-hydroxy-6-metoxy-1,4-benzoquinol methylase
MNIVPPGSSSQTKTQGNSRNCPVCRSLASPDRAVWEALALAHAPRTYTVMRCPCCRLRWLDPFPTEKDYQAIYNTDYYESPQGDGVSYAQEKEELSLCYTNIANRFKELGISQKLLDIGCGTGEFLTAAKATGIRCSGIEPSNHAATVATSRGHTVWHGSIEDVPAQPSSVEAAHCSHVLEHVPDAHRFLERLANLLVPGAPVYLEVPLQFDGILDRLQKLRWKRMQFTVHSIHHHFFFTPDSLTRLLREHGFEIMGLTTFVPCRRFKRPSGPRKWALQSFLWMADRLSHSGDVISVWARRAL